VSKTPEKYSVEWVFRKLPKLPRDLEAWANEEILPRSRYLVTHREKGVRVGYCTHCHAEGEVREKDYGLRSGDLGVCPSCQSAVTFKDSGRTFKNLQDKGYAYILQKAVGGGFVLQAGYVERDYSRGYRDVRTEFQPKYIIFYGEGVVKSYKEYWCWGAGPDFMPLKKTPNPSPVQVMGNRGRMGSYEKGDICGYYGFDGDVLAGSFLQHCNPVRMLRSWGIFPPICAYLALHTKHTALAEKLEKEKFFGLVARQANGDLPAHLVNWRAKTVAKALGMTKPEVRKLAASADIVTELVQYKFRKKHGLTREADRDYVFRVWDEKHYWDEIAKWIPLRDAFRYMRGQERLAERESEKCCHAAYARGAARYVEYRDYLQQCERLELDMTQESVLFPKNLIEAHERNTAILNERAKAEKQARDAEARQRRQEKALKFEAELPALREKYNWQSGGLLIRVAESEDDLLREGSSLGHCVHGYAERYIDRRTTVLFIRRENRAKQSYFTVEWSEKNATVLQCRGAKNAAPPAEVTAFLEDWQREIRQRKPKKRKKAEAA
jgi:hypothetical protein